VNKPIKVDLRLAVIMGSNLAMDMDVCLLWVLCVVKYRSLHQADHSSRGILLSVMCLNECDCEASIMRRTWSSRHFCIIKKNIYICVCVCVCVNNCSLSWLIFSLKYCILFCKCIVLFYLVQLLSNYTSLRHFNCILADTVGYVSLITGDDDNALPPTHRVCEQC